MQIFQETLSRDAHILLKMNDQDIENYFFNFLKKYHGSFDFRKPLCKTTKMKAYYINSAIKNGKISVESYNNNDKYAIFSIKEFSIVVANFYKRKLRGGKIWLLLF